MKDKARQLPNKAGAKEPRDPLAHYLHPYTTNPPNKVPVSTQSVEDQLCVPVLWSKKQGIN